LTTTNSNYNMFLVNCIMWLSCSKSSTHLLIRSRLFLIDLRSGSRSWTYIITHQCSSCSTNVLISNKNKFISHKETHHQSTSRWKCSHLYYH